MEYQLNLSQVNLEEERKQFQTYKAKTHQILESQKPSQQDTIEGKHREIPTNTDLLC